MSGGKHDFDFGAHCNISATTAQIPDLIEAAHEVAKIRIRRHSSGISEEKLIRAGRSTSASAFPNPDRVGCPGHQRLAILARQTSPPDQTMLTIDDVLGLLC